MFVYSSVWYLLPYMTSYSKAAGASNCHLRPTWNCYNIRLHIMAPLNGCLVCVMWWGEGQSFPLKFHFFINTYLGKLILYTLPVPVSIAEASCNSCNVTSIWKENIFQYNFFIIKSTAYPYPDILESIYFRLTSLVTYSQAVITIW